MPKLRSLPLLEKLDTEVTTEEQSKEIPTTPSVTNPTLTLFTDQQQAASTEQVQNILSSVLKPVGTTEKLKHISGSLPVTSTTGRIVRIPGARLPKSVP